MVNIYHHFPMEGKGLRPDVGSSVSVAVSQRSEQPESTNV